MCLNLKYENVDIIKKDKNIYKVNVSDKISKENLLLLLNDIYTIECEESFTDIILLNLRGLSVDLLSSAIKYSLQMENLKDPLMTLNIINLIKIYNTLDESFFSNEDNYFTCIDDLIDLKLLIRDELKAFSKKLSIYFISLFKSYNKLTYTPSDNIVKLPNIYRIILLSTDIMTLSGIFSASGTFDTKECVYIDDGVVILSQLLMKHSISMAFFDKFAETNFQQENLNDYSTK